MDRRPVQGQAVFQGMRGVLRCLGVHKPQRKCLWVRSYSGTYVIQQHETRMWASWRAWKALAFLGAWWVHACAESIIGRYSTYMHTSIAILGVAERLEGRRHVGCMHHASWPYGWRVFGARPRIAHSTRWLYAHMMEAGGCRRQKIR